MATTSSPSDNGGTFITEVDVTSPQGKQSSQDIPVDNVDTKFDAAEHTQQQQQQEQQELEVGDDARVFGMATAATVKMQASQVRKVTNRRAPKRDPKTGQEIKNEWQRDTDIMYESAS